MILKRPHYIALGVVVLLMLVLLNLPSQTTNRLKLALSSLFLPLVGFNRTSQQLAKQGGDALTSHAEILRQNAELRKANELLQLRAMEAETLLRQNDQLREQIGWRKQVHWNLKSANVIFRDPANWGATLRIDLGKRDDIKPDMAVLTKDGFVGRIESVGLTTSVVVLIGTPTCKVAAAIDKTGEEGVITGGAGPIENTLVTMRILGSGNTRSGQLVYTSGKGGIFPPGIRIGQVVESPHLAEMGSLEARVKLSADLNNLDIVWVRLP